MGFWRQVLSDPKLGRTKVYEADIWGKKEKKAIIFPFRLYKELIWLEKYSGARGRSLFIACL